MRFLLAFSSSYFIFDLFSTIFLTKAKGVMAIFFISHHLVSITGCLGAIFFGRFQISMTCLMLLTEMSTAFSNFRLMLDFHQMQSSILYAVNGGLFALVFFLCRILYIPYISLSFLLPSVLTFDRASLDSVEIAFFYFLPVTVPALYFINCFWFYKLIKGIVDILSP